MATYLFQSDDGETIERFYRMKDAPPIGTEIIVDGKTYRRVFCAEVGTAQVARVTHKYPFVSESLPRHVNLPCKRDHKGRQIIASQRQEREVLARAGYVRE